MSEDEMNAHDEPLCADCRYWRDYTNDIADHPDYDGHCWLNGIMTLNVKECREHDCYLTVENGKVRIVYREDVG